MSPITADHPFSTGDHAGRSSVGARLTPNRQRRPGYGPFWCYGQAACDRVISRTRRWTARSVGSTSAST